MGMKGVSFYIFAALANKHRAMKQPVTAQGPEYTLATDDDVNQTRRLHINASIRNQITPPLCAASMCIPRGCHATSTRHLSLSPRRFGGYGGGYCRCPPGAGDVRQASFFRPHLATNSAHKKSPISLTSQLFQPQQNSHNVWQL